MAVTAHECERPGCQNGWIAGQKPCPWCWKRRALKRYLAVKPGDVDYIDPLDRPEPDHTHADLRVGRQWLAEQAELYVPARVLMERVQAMEADMARIPVGTLSKHKTHRWTGRHWKEIEDARDR